MTTPIPRPRRDLQELVFRFFVAASIATTVLAIGGCAVNAVFIRLPSTPRFENLTEEQVFAMAPAA